MPALRALPDEFEIVGVANTNLESSQKAATAVGLPKAFANIDELVASPEIDVVTVTVRVSRHLELVKAALAAGKHVYCEWPLGNGLAEAEELAALAKAEGVRGIIGTQARVAPQVQYLKQLIADGYIGEVLSTTLIARGGQWGGIVPDKANGAYMLDNAEGATMLTIPPGHTLAGLQEALGGIAQLSSVLATRRSSALVAGTGEKLPVTAPDQVLVSGILGNGAPCTTRAGTQIIGKFPSPAPKPPRSGPFADKTQTGQLLGTAMCVRLALRNELSDDSSRWFKPIRDS